MVENVPHKPGEKPLNTAIPAELFDHFNQFRERQGRIPKKILVAWALYRFTKDFSMDQAPALEREFDRWLTRARDGSGGSRPKKVDAR